MAGGDPLDGFDELDHPDGPLGGQALTDEEAGLFVLFATALDPALPEESRGRLVEERAREWRELFG